MSLESLEADKEAAITEARRIANDNARYYRYKLREEQITGWLYYAAFSVEQDSVRVIEAELE